MARKLKSDKVLFIATILLVALSVVMVYSASAPVALERYGRASLFLIKQGMWALLGVAMLAVVMRIDYRAYKQPAFIWTALGLVTVALVAVYFRAPVNGARRWFGVGGIGVQPSELAKLVAIFFIAALLERRMHRIDEVTYSLLPIGIVVLGLVALILPEPDFGTSMSLLLIAAVMVFAAGLNYRYVAGALLCALPVLYLVVMGSAYRRRRTLAFLNPWDDPLGDGFQIIQSLIAVGTGGVWGKGLMNGVQKLFYLPEPHTDFIYSAIAEELGLVGATAVVLCFCVLTWRGMRIALRAPDTFGALLALGLTTMVAVQAFINISVVLGLMPTKGIPLPFVSFGGSSLLINLLGMGILLNVSQHVSSLEACGWVVTVRRLPDLKASRGAKEKMALRVVIAGGGTGGHLYPGIAVARELLARQPDAEISFAGTAKGIESRVIPREGFALDLIRSGGLKGKSIADRARGAILLPVSLGDAWSVVSVRRPDLVIGVGGYSSGPVVLMAALRGTTTMLLEQNAVPGLTNRLLARVVKAAAVTFDSTRTFFGSKAFVSGNPVRPEFLAAAGPKQESALDDQATVTQVLVFGGSQGAHAINVAMVEAAARLATGGPHLRVTHQTGERDVDMVRAAYRQAGLQADVEPFLYDMGRQLGAADLIVCRAGATTLAELTAAGKPAVLVPLPTATDDHQRKNAEALAASGAAEVLLQSELSGASLAERILALAVDRPRRGQIAAAAHALARPDAAKVIVDKALELVAR